MTSPNPPFAHLSVRSVHSLREGAIRLNELAARTRALGMTSVALTDRDTLGGAVRFAQACERYGVRPVYGVRLTVGDRVHADEARGRPPVVSVARQTVTLLAQTQDGY